MPLIAKLAIETACRNRLTFLKTSYCTQPFKLANITEDKTQNCLRLIIMSSSPGVLDGDSYELDLVIGAGCRVEVETQAYQRLFQMKDGASQKMAVRMARGSSFCYLPHPVVPHRQAIFRSESNLYLEDDCTLVWGEVLSCGRKQNGEVFEFSLLHNLTSIYKNGKLVVKENLLLRPSQINPQGMGQMEGYTHQATFIYLDEKADTPALTDLLVSTLKQYTGITFGVTALPVSGLLMRLMGFKAEELFFLIKTIAGMFKVNPMHQPKKQETYVS